MAQKSFEHFARSLSGARLASGRGRILKAADTLWAQLDGQTQNLSKLWLILIVSTAAVSGLTLAAGAGGLGAVSGAASSIELYQERRKTEKTAPITGAR